eukprot:CAMPEP_0172424910 /NCGR_PEP_ID=MMETSP1064-20121228/28795_1 /TAXON_ID=202472 /ORGANISM="Aulacoseira subarctica , Strain CCAP 1002/5" /LENGTH=596 /DNA_ID=CAMNT_0013167355 /DNA_START=27 /DNA_END=1817 /DNA_ORIENTATION=+
MTGFRRSNAVKISSLSEINSQNAILLTRLPKVFNDRYWLNFSTAAVPFDEKEELMRTAATVSQSLINPNDDGSNKSSIWTPRMTKIVGTIGPSSEQLPVLQQLVDSGLRIMRLNFSHATVEEVELRMKNLKLCKGRHGHKLTTNAVSNLRAVLLDTRGPEIRTGKLHGDTSGKKTITLEKGSIITLHTSPKWREAGSSSTDLFIDFANIAKCLHPGMTVLLDDGAVALTVRTANVQEGSVTCTIDNSGEIRSRAGVNLPGASTDMPAMSEKDREDIKYGLQIGVDYVAASFIQNAAGVREIRSYMREVMMKEMGNDWDMEGSPLPLLISKVESVSALLNFDEILEESDGIMVARGDLGVEIPIHQVTNVQKELVAKCNAVGKPVIVATQMLESMAKNPRPTRAEVADVTNAVLDGADAVMLSGETAKGKYPVECVNMMNDIIKNAEEFATRRPDLSGAAGNPTRIQLMNLNRPGKKNYLVSIAKACVTAAEEQNAAAIIVLTKHGTLGRLISAFRPKMPIIAFCPNDIVGRRLMIFRGVHPVVGLSGVSVHKRPAAAIQDAKKMGFVKAGDDVVMVCAEVRENMDNAVSMRIATVT